MCKTCTKDNFCDPFVILEEQLHASLLCALHMTKCMDPESLYTDAHDSLHAMRAPMRLHGAHRSGPTLHDASEGPGISWRSAHVQMLPLLQGLPLHQPQGELRDLNCGTYASRLASHPQDSLMLLPRLGPKSARAGEQHCHGMGACITHTHTHAVCFMIHVLAYICIHTYIHTYTHMTTTRTACM